MGHDADGVLKQFSYDEVIRPETTVEALSTLRPAFDPVTGDGHGRYLVGAV